MASMAVPAIDIRNAVLQALEDSERQPMELLKLVGQSGYADSDIKRAVSELIHEGTIELTSHRMLKIAVQSAA
jgi:DNA-binding IclR family transcriptional regulator